MDATKAYSWPPPQEIREKTDVSVTPVAADINTQNGRQLLLEACPDPDILVNNNWGPPPGKWEDFTYEDWLQAVEAAECKTLSREIAADNVTINNLLPERIDTERQVYMAQQRAKSAGIALRPSAWDNPRNSAPPAPTCAARTPVTSRGKTCSSTVEATKERSEEARRTIKLRSVHAGI